MWKLFCIMHSSSIFFFLWWLDYFLCANSFIMLVCTFILTYVQSAFDEKAFMKHSSQSSESTPISLCHAGLRLSRLSLTRIGCVERLLWVQMLDLSHNKLRSITGCFTLPIYNLLEILCSFFHTHTHTQHSIKTSS